MPRRVAYGRALVAVYREALEAKMTTFQDECFN